MRIAVIGIGYVGSLTAAGLAAAGHEVAVFDTNGARVSALVAGRPEVYEPGLPELVARTGGRLRAAAGTADAVGDATVAFVCVPTPPRADGRIDTSFVEAAVREIVAVRHPGPLVVAIRSTVVPGTTDRIDAEILGPIRKLGRTVEAAANPEFLREGRAVQDYLEPDRIVVGTSSAWARQTLRDLYRDDPTLMFTSRATAELAKYAGNTLLATLISFSNELADLAESVPGADVAGALRALHLDRRWRVDEGGWMPGILRYLWPGCGYGGSCLPKDVKAIVAEGERRGAAMPLLRATDAINERRARHIVDRIDRVRPLHGARVAVLGTAFKDGTQDERDSPGLTLTAELRTRGASVVTYDPLVTPAAGRGAAARLDEALERALVWVVVTGAPEFVDLAGRAHDAGALLVDARRRYADEVAGPAYLGPGLGDS